MSPLRWHPSPEGTVSDNGRFTIDRLDTSRYELTDRRTGRTFRRARLKDVKALTERIQVDEVVVR